MTSGYDGKEKKEKPIPLPHLRKWRAPYFKPAEAPNDEAIYLQITVDGESIGYVRLPDPLHVQFLREKLSHG